LTTRVFIADDHGVVRDGLRSLLEDRGRFEVVGEAVDGLQAVELVPRVKPDIVVMDITMPGMNGIEASARLTGMIPGLRVLILSVHATSEHVYRAFAAGARGYILKEAAGRELLEAMEVVAAGRIYLSGLIRETYPDIVVDLEQARSPIERLSPREREVMQLVAEGCSSNEVAARLGLSAKTVDTYRSRIMDKLNLRDITDLVRYAIENGITPISSRKG